jgi:hypothetical protein
MTAVGSRIAATRAGLLALTLLATGCAKPTSDGAAPSVSASAAPPTAPAWPELPRSPEAARVLIDARTERDRGLATAPPIDADTVLARAAARGYPSLISGEARIVRWIQAFLDRAVREGRDAYLLVGSYHDSGGQIDAFRRLIGPGGLRDLDLVAVEQLRADGAWRGVPVEAQRGDGASIDAYRERGDRLAFDSLAARHRESDYAAWKFGYEASVMELLVTARATGSAFQGGDMPLATQKLLAPLDDDQRLRLRELHALLSLPPARVPRRVAFLWGQAHARPGGLRRFLPASAAVLSIELFGFRSGEGTVEAALGKRLALVDPLLIPLDDASSELALLYPDAPGPLGAAVDRSRLDERAEPGLTVRSTRSATLEIGDQRTRIGPEATRLTVPAGEATYVVESEGARMIGALRLARGAAIELEIDPPRRTLSSVERAPRD